MRAMAATMQAMAVIETDWREPIEVLAAVADEPWAIGFVSGGQGEQARWSYLARRPDQTLIVPADDPADPFEAMAALLGPPSPPLTDGPPFQGGLAGLCAYELGARAERLPLRRLGDWPDLAVARYPAVLAFDHAKRNVRAIGRGGDDASARARAGEALTWLDETKPALTEISPLAGSLSCGPARAYEVAVADVVKRIGEGEIFQANIARAWRGRLTTGRTPFDLLVRLAQSSPAPFASYFRLPDRAVVSNSPERFVRVTPGANGLAVETRPIKGTLPRGKSPAEDARLAAALAASAKDRAENLMIVDLMRNDLARVCPPGSVETPDLFRVESFANVHHLVSTVTARLGPGRTAFDLLRASFPPGSSTGEPKVQAMKVIAALEAPRGPFFGSMFWAGFDGAFDSNVLIRTAAFEDDPEGWTIETRAGAGIVADSNSNAERRESEDKIAAILGALGDPKQNP